MNNTQATQPTVIELTLESFRSKVLSDPSPILIDFWAPWCGPCRMMAPAFAAAAQQLEPRVRFLKLNADQNQAPARLGVRGIPALILFHQGKEIARQAGLMSADQLSAWLSQALASVSTTESHL